MTVRRRLRATNLALSSPKEKGSTPHNQSKQVGEVALTFDDGVSTQLSVAVPILERHGLRGTFFIIPGLTESTTRLKSGQDNRGEIGWSDVVVLTSCGHEIGNHSLLHRDLVSAPLWTAAQEIEAGKRKIEDITGQSVFSFAYPFGRFNRMLKRLLARSHQCGRAITEDLVAIRASDRFAIPAWEVLSKTSPLELVLAAQSIVQNALSAVFVFHGFCERGYEPIEAESFRILVSALGQWQSDGNLKVRPLKELGVFRS